jgi:hypothetical protein
MLAEHEVDPFRMRLVLLALHTASSARQVLYLDTSLSIVCAYLDIQPLSAPAQGLLLLPLRMRVARRRRDVASCQDGMT